MSITHDEWHELAGAYRVNLVASYDVKGSGIVTALFTASNGKSLQFINHGLTIEQVRAAMDKAFGSPVLLSRNGAPLVSDIPGQLRALAGQIDRGERSPATLIVGLLEDDSLSADWLCWGEHPGSAVLLAAFILGQHTFTKTILGEE